MIPRTTSFALSLVAFLCANGAVALPSIISRQDGLPILSQDIIDSFLNFSHIASAAYCPPDKTIDWNCGDACDYLPGYTVTANGGDGSGVQYWFTAFSPESNSVVVAHQGTDPSEFLAVLTDISFLPEKPNATLFPGIADEVEMHGGFLKDHAKTADLIYDAVVETMATYSTTNVTLVGHSLGAALSLLDAVSLQLRLPNTTSFKVIGYGMPRVGNQAFADTVDNILPDLTRITNRLDPIPIVPLKAMGFVHPHGEIHVASDTDWYPCPGQESDDERCAAATVSIPLNMNIVDHIGYYNRVLIQCWGIPGL